MRIEPFREYYKDWSLEQQTFPNFPSISLNWIFRQSYNTTLRMSARSERLYHASNINDIPTNGAPLTFVNRSELPTDQSKSQKIACFHGNKRLDQSEHWILTFWLTDFAYVSCSLTWLSSSAQPLYEIWSLDYSSIGMLIATAAW